MSPGKGHETQLKTDSEEVVGVDRWRAVHKRRRGQWLLTENGSNIDKNHCVLLCIAVHAAVVHTTAVHTAAVHKAEVHTAAVRTAAVPLFTAPTRARHRRR